MKYVNAGAEWQLLWLQSKNLLIIYTFLGIVKFSSFKAKKHQYPDTISASAVGEYESCSQRNFTHFLFWPSVTLGWQFLRYSAMLSDFTIEISSLYRLYCRVSLLYISLRICDVMNQLSHWVYLYTLFSSHY